MEVRIEIEGAKDLEQALASVQGRAKLILPAALWQAAQIIRNEAVRGIMKGPKTGRWYGRHQASKPGEYPAADTGNLSRSIQQKTVALPRGPAVDVEATASYAEPLELKAPERGGRPFMSRAFDAKVLDAIRVIEAALQALFPGDRIVTRR